MCSITYIILYGFLAFTHGIISHGEVTISHVRCIPKVVSLCFVILVFHQATRCHGLLSL